MTSTAKKIPWKVHPWRIKRLPTLPVQFAVSQFFLRKPRNTQHHTPLNSPFEARIQPIKPLVSPACPHESGTFILRAFLYARRKWPMTPFANVSAQAMEAVYESLRVDGLPRVVFGVSKDVEKPLRGKLHGCLRHQFKRRGKVAFKIALETLRRENPDFRCDLDIMFLLNRNTVLLPFEQLVQAMRSTLVNVNPSIIKEGRLNAKQSESFLAKRHARPYHALTNLARSMKLHEMTREELQKLRMEVLRDRQKRKENDVEIDLERLAGHLVRGRHSDMRLLEDGKVVSLSSQEAKDLDIKPKSRSMGLDALTDRPLRIRNHRNVQQTPSHDPFVSQTRDIPTKPALNPLSDWNTIDTLKYTPPRVEKPRPVEGGFDYLFGSVAESPSKSTVANEVEKSDISLEWPPRKSDRNVIEKEDAGDYIDNRVDGAD